MATQAFPTTAAEVQAALDDVEAKITAALDSPESFASQNGGSVKIDMTAYVAALERRRGVLKDQLNKFPFWLETDFEETL